jgi:hypothetical protein
LTHAQRPSADHRPRPADREVRSMIRVFLVFFLSIAGGLASIQPPDTPSLATAAFLAFTCCALLRRDEKWRW